MEELVEKYTSKIENALEIASDVIKQPDDMRTKLNEFLLSVMRGKSSKEMRIFFNELVDENTSYLQIGGLSYGHTIISALYQNDAKHAVGVDHYGGPIFADDVRDKLMQVAYYHSLEVDEKFFLIHKDYFKLDENDKEILRKHKFNLLYYNGEPRIDYHIKKFTEYYDYLDDVFIYITSNTEKQETLQGSKIGMETCNLKVLKEWHLEPVGDYKKPGKLSWYNGLYVAILQK